MIEATGTFLKAIIAPESSGGPPYTHVHRLPETEEEADADPFLPSLTIETGLA